MKKIVSVFMSMLLMPSAQAVDIGLVGLFPGKAVLVVDAEAPKIFTVGSTIVEGIRLISADRETASIEVNGKRQILTLGQYVHRSAASKNSSVILQADARGHFTARGQINGGSSLDMLVDTGASLIAIPAAEAKRLGIDYKNGKKSRASTANGIVNTYIVRLDSIKIGDIELNQVDASILEEGLPTSLLGMSFLNRMEMTRNGEQMILKKRF